MSTGDLKNNLRKLGSELKACRYEEIPDFDGLARGVPDSFQPIYRYLFMEFSGLLAERLGDVHVNISDQSSTVQFADNLYRALRTLLSYKPLVNRDQFLSPGYAERKIIMCTEIGRYIRQKYKMTTARGPKSARGSVSNTSTVSGGPLSGSLTASNVLGRPLSSHYTAPLLPVELKPEIEWNEPKAVEKPESAAAEETTSLRKVDTETRRKQTQLRKLNAASIKRDKLKKLNGEFCMTTQTIEEIHRSLTELEKCFRTVASRLDHLESRCVALDILARGRTEKKRSEAKPTLNDLRSVSSRISLCESKLEQLEKQDEEVKRRRALYEYEYAQALRYSEALQEFHGITSSCDKGTQCSSSEEKHEETIMTDGHFVSYSNLSSPRRGAGDDGSFAVDVTTESVADADTSQKRTVGTHRSSKGNNRPISSDSDDVGFVSAQTSIVEISSTPGVSDG